MMENEEERKGEGPAVLGELSAFQMYPEEVKMGEECDGFERLYEIVARIIAANHPDDSLNTEEFTIDGLLPLLQLVLEQVHQEVNEKMATLFMRDDRTPGGDPA